MFAASSAPAQKVHAAPAPRSVALLISAASLQLARQPEALGALCVCMQRAEPAHQPQPGAAAHAEQLVASSQARQQRRFCVLTHVLRCPGVCSQRCCAATVTPCHNFLQSLAHPL